MTVQPVMYVITQSSNKHEGERESFADQYNPVTNVITKCHKWEGKWIFSRALDTMSLESCNLNILVQNDDREAIMWTLTKAVVEIMKGYYLN